MLNFAQKAGGIDEREGGIGIKKEGESTKEKAENLKAGESVRLGSVIKRMRKYKREGKKGNS